MTGATHGTPFTTSTQNWRVTEMRTKAEILQARRDYLSAELEKANREILGLQGTPCGLTCDSCGTVLASEWDFASHFLIPDEQYLNLGGCPDGNYIRKNPPRISVHFKLTTLIGKG